MKRKRPIYAVATILVIIAGLLSRSHPNLFPAVLGKFPGDAFWAIMVFCAIGFLFPRWSTPIVGLSAFAFSCAIEFSQLYHASWIEALRDTLPGRLVLGRGFSWADIAAYAVGILIGCTWEAGFRVFHGRKKSGGSPGQPERLR